MLRDLFYLIIIIVIPIPTYPLVVLFFTSNNIIYSVILYIISLQIIYLSIYFLCYKFRIQYNYRKIPSFFPARTRRLKLSFVNDLLKGDLLKIISILNIIQIPIFAAAFLFGYYKTKLSSVILFGVYAGLINSITYICISLTGKSLLSSIGIPESYTINDLISYFILIISLVYIIFTQKRSLTKIIRSLTYKIKK